MASHGVGAMPNTPTTSVLLIDANDTDRIRFAAHLKNCSPDYTTFEARDGQSGLDLYRSRRIDCVVLSLDLPDQSGFRVLVNLVPIASRPHVAVVVLTDRATRGVHEIAMQNGAYACFVRQFTSGDDLERAILRAMAFVGQMPKEDRYRLTI
jgi:DNA-binding NarL/FixJ family response regulator